MKNFKWMRLSLILMLTLFMQSCLNDSDSWPSDTSLAIVTVREKENDELINFHFVLDNGKTVNPISINNITYKAIDGQRAFAYLRLLNAKSALADDSYDYNAEVFYVENILTKNIVELNTTNKDSIGNDVIDISKIWMAQGYITIECQLYVLNEGVKHMLNLVYNADQPMIDDDGYIQLEFRQNAFSNLGSLKREGIVSFKLDSIYELLETAKGVKVVSYSNKGIVSYKLDLKNNAQPNRLGATNTTKTKVY